jgi:hypothetical protein
MRIFRYRSCAEFPDREVVRDREDPRDREDRKDPKDLRELREFRVESELPEQLVRRGQWEPRELPEIPEREDRLDRGER